MYCNQESRGSVVRPYASDLAILGEGSRLPDTLGQFAFVKCKEFSV